MSIARTRQPISFRWLGVAGIDLSLKHETLLIDPFLTRPPIRYLFSGRAIPNTELIAEKIKRADHILVTHAHYDHLMDVPEIALRTGAQVYGSANTCQLMYIHNIADKQITLIKAGEKFSTNDAEIEVIPARHPALPGHTSGSLKPNLIPPLHLRDYRMDDCFNFLIQINNLKILIWSGISSQYAKQADVLFMHPITAPALYQEMLGLVRPRLMIPIHWDNLFQPTTLPIHPFFALPILNFPPIKLITISRFQEKIQLADPKCRVFIPEIFQPCDLCREIAFSD